MLLLLTGANVKPRPAIMTGTVRPTAGKDAS